MLLFLEWVLLANITGFVGGGIVRTDDKVPVRIAP